MLPANIPSSISFGGLYLPPDDVISSRLVDHERGGVALLDTTQGLLSHYWRCFLDGIDIYIQRAGADPILVHQATQITELTFTFDQNMHYCLAYIQAGILKLYWFDAVSNAFVISEFGAAVNPRLSLDDKRPEAILTSDMILAYIRGTSLCYRQQRDRFLVERVLRTGLFPDTQLKNIGMSKNLRLQFELV